MNKPMEDHRVRRRRTRGWAFAPAVGSIATLCFVMVALSVVGGPASGAGGPTVVVTNCNAAGPGSLPDAVANATDGTTITFDMAPACTTIVLTSTIDIGRNISIEGPGAGELAVSGNGAFQVFDVGSDFSTISGLTIEDGNATDGGGIENGGTLTVVDCTLSDNEATSEGGGIYNRGTLSFSGALSDNSAVDGGGIYNNSLAGASEINLTITGTLSGNVATDDGGGLYNFAGTTSLNDATVSDNTVTSASGAGGGVFNIDTVEINGSTVSGNSSDNGGGIYNDRTLDLTTDTLSGNSAVGDGGGVSNDNVGTTTATWVTLSGNSASHGGGIDNSGTMSAAATIVADSTTGGDCVGSIGDLGYNLDDDGSCGFSATDHSLSGINPDLGPLQDNGGPTQTQAPAVDSAVLNQIPPHVAGPSGTALCPRIDQRGVDGPQGTWCDMGAVELVGSQTITSADNTTATAGTEFSFTATTTGPPVARLMARGQLPPHIRFVDHHNGTATISGKSQKVGLYKLTITAIWVSGTGRHRVVNRVNQTFWLTVAANETA